VSDWALAIVSHVVPFGCAVSNDNDSGIQSLTQSIPSGKVD
jgi:hypothetical protein